MATKKVIVRGGFTVHLGGEIYPEGEHLELSEEELALVAHQVEDAPKRAAKSTTEPKE